MNGMQRPIRRELLEASDAFIDDAVQFADPMVLRGLIYQLTGDPEIAGTELTMMARSAIPMPAPANPEVAQLLRRKAAEYLKAYRDSGGGPVGDPRGDGLWPAQGRGRPLFGAHGPAPRGQARAHGPRLRPPPSVRARGGARGMTETSAWAERSPRVGGA